VLQQLGASPAKWTRTFRQPLGGTLLLAVQAAHGLLVAGKDATADDTIATGIAACEFLTFASVTMAYMSYRGRCAAHMPQADCVLTPGRAPAVNAAGHMGWRLIARC
jgi:hypothetical protein